MLNFKNASMFTSVHDDNSTVLPINLLAGTQLLAKNQQQWEEMHTRSQYNVEKSKLVIEKFDKISDHVTNRKNALYNLQSSLMGYKDIMETVDEVSRDISKLLDSFAAIENNLIVLQNAKEEVDVVNFQNSQEGVIKEFIGTKNKEFEVTKQRMEREHQERVREFEKKQEAIMEERRRLHEQAFQEEMQRYLESNKSVH